MKIYGLFIFIASAVAISAMTIAGTTVTPEPKQIIQVESHIIINQTKFDDSPCKNDTECDYSETCHNNQCIAACTHRDGIHVSKRCGVNAYCYIGTAHIAACGCYPTYRGNPDSGCFEPTDFLAYLERMQNQFSLL